MKLKILFLLAFFVFGTFASCSSTGPEDDPVSSSGGGNGGSSSSGGDNNPSSSGNSSSSGGGTSSSGNGSSDASWTGWPFDASDENLQATPACPSPSNAIEIKYNGGNAPEIIGSDASGVSVSTDGENVAITLTGATERDVVLSGTAQNGSLKVSSQDRVNLYLNGVNITNGSGPAINIQKSSGKGRTNVCLASGKENYLEGASTPVQGSEKGAFFSEEKLTFTGNGSLEVKSRQGHAIVVDNDIEIENGKIIISQTAGDGIHANDRIEIKGGVIKIASVGDAVQSERDSVIVSGGKILAKTTGIKSHGITSEGSTSIRGSAKVQISVLGNGSKGIKSTRWMEILGGTAAILTKGNQDRNDADTSTAAGVKVDADFFVEGGNLTIQSQGSKAKGINTSGNIEMTAGNINVEADDDAIKVHGALKMSGGSITAASLNKEVIDGTVQKTGGTINGH